MSKPRTEQPTGPSLKLKTARTLKWNIIDRVSQQVLYAVTGIVLARELSQTEFGLVGAVLIFQAFASLIIDSGFSYALIQRRNPTRLDYSTVLWFNIGMSGALYALLWFSAPLIAEWFGSDELIPLSRVMFLTFILNATAIVQANRFVKQMNVRPIAISNTLGLGLGAVVGIVMALTGYGVWAIVWQNIVGSSVKSLVLWLTARWLPLFRFSLKSLRSFMAVGMGMMATSFLNTVFLNLYSFVIGKCIGLAQLGYYTQSDKWSKMGISSITQVLTSTTLPVLSEAQNDADRFSRIVHKFNRMAAYFVFPAMLGLAAEATPLFHTLFGAKWDASIILFRILLIRGIFTTLTSLYSNYLLSLGKARLIVWMEVLRDGTAVIALAATWPYLSLNTAAAPLLGIEILLWGQLVASVLAWGGTLWAVVAVTHITARSMIADSIPYASLSVGVACLAFFVGDIIAIDWLGLICATTAGAALYLGINALLHSRIQTDAVAYLRGRL